nr:MAG TPA: Ribosome associated membrane protein RAMP4 [Caudoviricetes sp.]
MKRIGIYTMLALLSFVIGYAGGAIYQILTEV